MTDTSDKNATLKAPSTSLKEYHPPVLTEYGSVAEITQSGGSNGNTDVFPQTSRGGNFPVRFSAKM